MIIWLNGRFGGGKTSVARALVDRATSLAIFDAEEVGYMLGHALSRPRPVRDFQDWPPWRNLVVAAAREVHDYLGGDLVIPQTVLNRAYWGELMAGFGTSGIAVRTFTLDTSPAEHQRRILTDEIDGTARDWRLEMAPSFRDALGWLREETTIVDTTARNPAEVACDISTRLASE